MRQAEARDLRLFLDEPVEDIVVEEARERVVSLRQDELEDADVAVQLTGSWEGANVPLHEAGIRFMAPWEGTDAQLQGTGTQFTTPWESTGGQLHEVGARFTGPLVANDLTLQQTMPMVQVADMSGGKSGQSTLRPYRLQRYQSRGIPVSLSRSASGTLHLRPAGSKERRATADLAPAPQKVVPVSPSPAQKSWERRRRDIYTWLVLLIVFLLVILGGIGLDSLIANYR